MARPSSSDDAVERLLKRSLGAHGATEGEVCPDPDVLAAFADKELSRADALQVERHASSCARCTQILASVVRAEPAASVEHGGGLMAAWRMWRWAIPVATATTVAGLWFVSSRPETLRDEVSRSRAVSQVAEPQQQAPLEEPRQPASPPAPATSTLRDERANVQARKESDRALANADAKAEVTESAARRETEAPASTAVEQSEQRQAKSSTAQAAPPPERARAAAPSSAPSAAQVAGNASPVAGSASPSSRVARFAAEVDLPVLRGRDPNVAWRAQGTVIQRSNDGGRSWKEEYSASQPITGGVSAGGVVWFFGRAGLVLRQTPTAGWVAVTPPANADVVAMEATSADAATLTLSDGRRFQTVNGGATWIGR